jgi:glycosyltransferase involved in cell wall biosynthesis
MLSMVEVTVLLPVYNGEQYLHETMQSILGQTYTGFEFLIVDDGSTDTTPAIISSYDDPRIRLLVNHTRLKLSGALNRGIDEARGRFIARMDADDIAMPGRLQKQVEYLCAYPEIGICGTAIEVFGSSKRRTDVYPMTREDIRSYALFDCPFCHPTVMIRKELFNNHQLRYDGSFYPTEDFELWTRAVELFPAANLADVLLRYRVHEKSMTGADWVDMDRQAARVTEPLLKRLGVRFTQEQLRFHRDIGRGRSVRLQDFAELDRAEAWLLELIERNRFERCYEETAFRTVVGTVWYRLCMNSSWLGLALVDRYKRSTLAGGAANYQRLIMLAGSALKQKLSPSMSGDK